MDELFCGLHNEMAMNATNAVGVVVSCPTDVLDMLVQSHDRVECCTQVSDVS